LAQVVDVDVLGLDAHHLRLGARRLELLALAEVGGEGDDLAVVSHLQPLEDHAGVEAARVGQHDTLDIGHRLLRWIRARRLSGRAPPGNGARYQRMVRAPSCGLSRVMWLSQALGLRSMSLG